MVFIALLLAQAGGLEASETAPAGDGPSRTSAPASAATPAPRPEATAEPIPARAPDLTWEPDVRSSLRDSTPLQWLPLPLKATMQPDKQDLGVLDPRQAGCLTQTPGLRPTPACRIALESRFGPQAVQPAATDRRRPGPRAATPSAPD